jgi:predicted ATPase/DNA-binding winged helix-turn-helix (wHTH) protein
MPDLTDAAADRAVTFGPFRLFPAQQLLLENGRPLRLGSRAFGILVALVERAGELVTKEELVAKVWPNIAVQENNLRVNMAALRRMLGDGQAGNRFIATAPGRGYRFVAQLSRVEQQRQAATPAVAKERAHNLPVLLTRLHGRAEVVESLVNQLPKSRFVTLVGPGGIGKTTVALATAEALMANYKDHVCFVNFAPISDAGLVPSVVAFALDPPIRTDFPLDELISFLAEKATLLVLDGCEDVIDAVASLAEEVSKSARGVHILATSLEPLRVAGEHVVRLRPLGLPPPPQAMRAADALTYPAIQLFVERAATIVQGFELNDANTPIVSEICRRLDGIPLAIELAAGRVDAFGVHDLAAQLDNRFALLTRGRRTALQRHQTLRATLDWSYNHLLQVERAILNRVAIFAGGFTLEAASAVAADDEVTVADVIDGIANLVEKSLVVADAGDVGVYYRLLNTTRAYALEKLTEGGELGRIARCHAEHVRDLFERAETEWETRPTAEWLVAYSGEVDNVRTALDWAFSTDGDASLGVALTVAAVPLWLELSLIKECRTRVERALTVPDAVDRDERRKMKLFAALGWSLMYARVPASGAAWATALELAEALDDTDYRLRALRGMWAGSQTVGDFRKSRLLAQSFFALAVGSANPSDLPVGDRMMGAALHFLGDQAGARHHIQRALDHYVIPNRRSDIVRFQFEQRASARIVLARILWLEGYPDQARREVENNVEQALSVKHVISLCNVLAQAACPISLLAGDFDAAERFNAILLDHTERYGLDYLRAYSECFSGQILMKRGNFAAGLRLCRSATDNLREARSVQYLTAFLGALAEGSGEARHVAEGLTAVNEALQRCENYEERWCIAELLRIKGELILCDAGPNAAVTAEGHFLQSLDWSQRQGALSWELRTATSLARLRRSQGRDNDARDLVASVYNRFQEGFDTADLKAARELRDS